MKIGVETLDIEVTEAMMTDRKRADEYASDAPSIRPDPVEEWDRRLNELPRELNQVIYKKTRKLYGQKPTLLVYLNIDAHEDYRGEEIRSNIATIKDLYAKDFRALHVMWGNELL